jgi:transcriptional regulator with XRE-family HTH domain
VGFAISSRDVSDMVAQRLRGTGLPPKLIARRLGTSPRTVEDWINGENAPSAATLIRIMGEFDDVYDGVVELTGRRPKPMLSAQSQQAIADALKLLTEP